MSNNLEKKKNRPITNMVSNPVWYTVPSHLEQASNTNPKQCLF